LLVELYRIETYDVKLACLHGDFWGANFYFKTDGSSWVIDYSRIPYGDPAIDVGWWISQYIWLYIKTKKTLYKQLLKFFLDDYISISADLEIKERLPAVIALMMIINISPRLYPMNKDSINNAMGFYNYTIMCLNQRKLIGL
jgi:thiamine kinase-like enzyme